MPDMRTEMRKVVETWDMTKTDQQPKEQTIKHIPFFKVTNNVTRATFDYVKNNPRQSCKEICAALEKDGYKSTSVGSLLTQFVKNGLCVRDNMNNYTALVNEYSPIKVRKQPKAKQAKQVIEKAKATRGQGIAALSPQPIVKTAWDVETVINNIGLKQAHELYRELHTYFGG